MKPLSPSSQAALGKLIAVVSVTSALALIVASVIAVDERPRTHDAYIFAYSDGIAPEVSGRIVSVAVHNDQFVHRGDTLARIDPEPFELKLREATARVSQLQAEIELTARRVAGEQSGARAATHEVDRARQSWALAADTARRLAPLTAQGFATQQKLDEAQTQEQTASAALAAAIEQAAQARQTVGDVASLEAQLQGAQAERALAARDLRETEIRAPIDGKITGFALAVGAYATQGHPLFSLIDTAHWYAIADFRETDLHHVVAGGPATVWLMGDEARPLHGTVESVGRAVQPAGATGPGLPQVNRDLNWVVVAQRFPVWVRLDARGSDALRIGATASVRIDHGLGN
jgi:multidrug efflux system membrane fusion protein